GGEGQHGPHVFAGKGPRRREVNLGRVNGYNGVALDGAGGQARVDQRQLEGKRAAQYEGHEVVGPIGADVGRLGDELAIFEQAITRHIRADVDVAEVGEARIAWRAHADEGAWLGVPLAEGG